MKKMEKRWQAWTNLYQPIPNASVSKLFGDRNISNGHGIVYVSSNAKMDYSCYIKHVQHLLCCCSCIDLKEPKKTLIK